MAGRCSQRQRQRRAGAAVNTWAGRPCTPSVSCLSVLELSEAELGARELVRNPDRRYISEALQLLQAPREIEDVLEGAFRDMARLLPGGEEIFNHLGALSDALGGLPGGTFEWHLGVFTDDLQRVEVSAPLMNSFMAPRQLLPKFLPSLWHVVTLCCRDTASIEADIPPLVHVNSVDLHPYRALSHACCRWLQAATRMARSRPSRRGRCRRGWAPPAAMTAAAPRPRPTPRLQGTCTPCAALPSRQDHAVSRRSHPGIAQSSARSPAQYKHNILGTPFRTVAPGASHGSPSYDYGSPEANRTVEKLAKMGCVVHPPGNAEVTDWGVLAGASLSLQDCRCRTTAGLHRQGDRKNKGGRQRKERGGRCSFYCLALSRFDRRKPQRQTTERNTLP